MNLFRFFFAGLISFILLTSGGHQTSEALTGEKLPLFTVKILDGIRVSSKYVLNGSVLRAKTPISVLLVPNSSEYLGNSLVTGASGLIKCKSKIGKIQRSRSFRSTSSSFVLRPDAGSCTLTGEVTLSDGRREAITESSFTSVSLKKKKRPGQLDKRGKLAISLVTESGSVLPLSSIQTINSQKQYPANEVSMAVDAQFFDTKSRGKSRLLRGKKLTVTVISPRGIVSITEADSTQGLVKLGLNILSAGTYLIKVTVKGSSASQLGEVAFVVTLPPSLIGPPLLNRTITPRPLPTSGSSSFYKAFDFGSRQSITIDGKVWEGVGDASVKSDSSISTNGITKYLTPSVNLDPFVSGPLFSMLKNFLWKEEGVKVTVTGLPNGIYEIFVYTVEDNEPATFDLFLNNKIAKRNIASGSAGFWQRIGPVRIEVTNGLIVLEGKNEHVNLAGAELFKIDRVTTPQITQTPKPITQTTPIAVPQITPTLVSITTPTPSVVVSPSFAPVPGFTLTPSLTSTPNNGDIITSGLLQEFKLKERFAVSHSDQIVELDLSSIAQKSLAAAFVSGQYRAALLTSPGGVEIPFQVIEEGKKLAIRTNLASGEEKKWQLMVGRNPSVMASSPLSISETADHIEIASGLTALRLPNFATPGKAVGYTSANSPSKALRNLPHIAPNESLFALAPIQGVRLANGIWTASGSNMLVARANKLLEASVRFIEKGPLRLVAQVSYKFEKPVYDYGSTIISNAGLGYYSFTVKAEAGQPSFVFEEDTDLDMIWALNMHEGLNPDQARYRANLSSSVERGREPDGRKYRPWHERAGLDALVDLKYPEQPDVRPFMAVWNPWIYDAGWYWQAFDSKANSSANLVGLFAGRASRALGAHNSGVSVFTQAADPRNLSKKVFGFAVESYRRGHDARIFPRSRFQWGLYLTNREQLKAPEEVQPINRQMNIHGGLNLSKINRWVFDFPDPSQGYGAAFMSRSAMEALRKRVREDNDYYNFLVQKDSWTRPILDSWRESGREKLAQSVQSVVKDAKEMMDTLINGQGVMDLKHHYWMGGLIAQRNGVWLDQLLADSRLTDLERASLKAAAVLFGEVMWDEDHSPIGIESIGVNLGNENMALQHSGYRQFYALFLARNPTMSQRVNQVEQKVRASLEQQVDESGAHIGSSHYMSASFTPTLNIILQLEQLGRSPFANWPKLNKFAEYLLNIQAPSDPRRDRKRTILTFGDAGIEGSALYGLLGTGFSNANPSLSRRLMAAWRVGGKEHSAFFGSSLMMIDDTLSSVEVPLGDAFFAGSMGILRHGWNTANETALFLLAGNHYRDHRHEGDVGSISLYGLGVPLSTDWASLYEPHVPGAYQHSTVVPEDAIGHSWAQNGSALNQGSYIWSQSNQEDFSSNSGGAFVRAKMKRANSKLDWTRTATVVRLAEDLPVIVIQDRFSGEQSRVPKVASFNLMAQGSVMTSGGMITPPQHTHPKAQREESPPASHLPSSSLPISFSAGANEFGFTGRHGVDFSVFVIGDEPHDVAIGNWGVTAWGNGLTPNKEERQHILRVKSNGTFNTVLVPWRAGNKPSGLSVTKDGSNIKIVASGKLTIVAPDGSWQTNSMSQQTQTPLAVTVSVPSPTATPTLSTTATLSPTATAFFTPTVNSTPTFTPIQIPSFIPTAIVIPTATPVLESTATINATVTVTATAAIIPTVTFTPTMTPIVIASPTPTAVVSPTLAPTSIPTPSLVSQVHFSSSYTFTGGSVGVGLATGKSGKVKGKRNK